MSLRDIKTCCEPLGSKEAELLGRKTLSHDSDEQENQQKRYRV
ncbi:MAG: hypothetical protein FD167_6186, partial [bacterium]